MEERGNKGSFTFFCNPSGYAGFTTIVLDICLLDDDNSHIYWWATAFARCQCLQNAGPLWHSCCSPFIPLFYELGQGRDSLFRVIHLGIQKKNSLHSFFFVSEYLCYFCIIYSSFLNTLVILITWLFSHEL